MNKSLLVSAFFVVGGFFLLNPASVEAAPPPIISVVADPSPGAENQGVIITLEPLPGAAKYGFVFVSPPEFGGSGGQWLTEYQTTPVESGWVEYIPKFRFNFWGIDENGNRFGEFDEVVLDNPNYVAPQPPAPTPAPTPTPTPAPQPAPAPVVDPVPSPESTSSSTESTSDTTTSEEANPEIFQMSLSSTSSSDTNESPASGLTSDQVLVVGLIGTGTVALGGGIAFAGSKLGWWAKLMSLFRK
ncbi:MAG: hypothetical protein JNK26_02965 [Candidatus Doudnabacteria bacterium]|nr:hypothetical protein [Candidatus Doudnabacteria bacterium]